MSYIQKRGQNTAWRESLMRNLTTELILNESLQLTQTRAKELQVHFDHMITLAKRNDLHARRQASAWLRNIQANEKETALQKLFTTLNKRYQDRNGGYTRILKLDNRKGDNAPMVLIELV
ncbi:50S ribosomal protein L17 [Mesoplasma sp. JKS002658]|uniref:50S ribosomal protein L17 n=1 Tax=Mesoplasma whartonense TaxID=2878854 RepID=UPI000A27BD4C|nr:MULTISPECIES: 50S ribosomal protein L17 [unclassified Mesoplasma]MCL8211364.1 50S ribosomal protein L17 [Mesoplasma sp. JKS002664]MCL8212217.1 50S ribosomal protein L17 [Mesoplasma sp. JKS002662]MCL8212519.1 50S ribosomal protein L17 [Mesoplasma sp. JKS002661]MCL8213359.1 50S ribosomal protein L17 [Mesoplasma sp. JKS002660]MCL8214254.1 50S ribosomal protein L17 [Mesoplasma sp. JKS002658]